MRNLYFLLCFLLVSSTLGFFSRYLDLEPYSGKDKTQELYAVQLASLKYPVYLSYFKGVTNVVEMKGKDGMFRYCVKPFGAKEDASKLCDQLKQSGYPEGCVICISEEFAPKALAEATSQKVSAVNGEVRITESDDALSKIRNSQDQKDKTFVSQEEKTLDGMKGVGTSYFYSIRLKKSKTPLNPTDFGDFRNVKEFNDDKGQFCYLFGNFADVEDAELFLKKELKSKFDGACVVVVDKGKVQNTVPVANKNYGQANILPQKKRKKGRQYVDYYYEDPEVKISSVSSLMKYSIVLGTFDDFEQAQSQVLKLRHLGYPSARLVEKGSLKYNKVSKPVKTTTNNTSKAVGSPRYTIQVLASSVAKDPSSLKLKGVKRDHSKSDHLYRYYYGMYDNYWVCRRELREVRYQGYKDAFIVKVK